MANDLNPLFLPFVADHQLSTEEGFDTVYDGNVLVDYLDVLEATVSTWLAFYFVPYLQRQVPCLRHSLLRSVSLLACWLTLEHRWPWPSKDESHLAGTHNWVLLAVQTRSGIFCNNF